MSITLSEKYGVNPSVDTCFICGKETSLVLFGESYKDENGKTAEAPRTVCSGGLCDTCQKVIDEGGIFFIADKNGERVCNHYRTGQIGALKEEAVQRMFPDFPYKKINYIEESAYKQIFENNA